MFDQESSDEAGDHADLFSESPEELPEAPRNHSRSVDRVLKEYPKLYNNIAQFISYLLKDTFGPRAPQEAANLVQEVFARAIRAERFPDLNAPQKVIEAWFKTVAKFTVKDFIRSYSGQQSERDGPRPGGRAVEPQVLPRAWELPLEQSILYKRHIRPGQPQVVSPAQLMRAVGKLTPRERQAIESELGFSLTEENLSLVIAGEAPREEPVTESAPAGSKSVYATAYRGLNFLDRARRVLAEALGMPELLADTDHTGLLGKVPVRTLDYLISKLAGENLEIARMYFQEGLTQSQIAARFKLTQAAISLRLEKIKQLMIEALET